MKPRLVGVLVCDKEMLDFYRAAVADQPQWFHKEIPLYGKVEAVMLIVFCCREPES